MGWNDPRGFSPGGTTPAEPFCPGMERLQGSHSVLGRNDSREDIQCLSNDSRGVLLSWDTTTSGESFCPGIELLQGSQSVLR